MSEAMILRCDKNQCQGCKKYFKSTAAFDKHRIGKHGIDRRCATTEEMLAKGMVDRDGWWSSSAFVGSWWGKACEPMPQKATPEGCAPAENRRSQASR